MAVHAFFTNTITISLFILALGILLTGIIIRIFRWGHGKPIQFLSTWKHETFHTGVKPFLRVLLLEVLLFKRIWKRSKRRWIMHMAIYWGFMFLGGCLILSLVMSLAAYFDPNGFGGFFAENLENFHLPYDLIGYFLLVGSLYALGRRLCIKRIRERSKISDYILICSVLLILLSGMVAEWLSGFGSFIGNAILNWDLAVAWMEFHIYFALLFFIMIIPWSKFKHIFTVPLTVLARRGGE